MGMVIIIVIQIKIVATMRKHDPRLNICKVRISDTKDIIHQTTALLSRSSSVAGTGPGGGSGGGAVTSSPSLSPSLSI